MKHVHGFIDTPCGCGLMLSDYVRNLKELNIAFLSVLEYAEDSLSCRIESSAPQALLLDKIHVAINLAKKNL